MEEKALQSSTNLEVIGDNGIIFGLDTLKNEANIISSPKAKGKILIPISIKYQAKDYYVSSVMSDSFNNNKQIEALTFKEPSRVSSFQSNAFKLSSITKIYIPQSVTELCEGWCNETPNLNFIQISPSNKNFIYLNNQCIIGKSNSATDNYDVMIFARLDITKVAIPSFIKTIGPYCFQNCLKLNSVFFKDSSLTLIDKYAFENSSLKAKNIPKSVEWIKEYAFFNYQHLNSDDILKKCKHIEIEKNAFNESIIESEQQPKYVFNDEKPFENEINKNMEILLDNNEKKQFNAICSHFQQLKYITYETYYSLIDSLAHFSIEGKNKWNINRSTLSGIIKSFLCFEYEDQTGTIILINIDQIELLIQKSRYTFINSFLKKYTFVLSIEELTKIFGRKTKQLNKMLALKNIMFKLGYKYEFYFLKDATFEYDKFLFKIFNPYQDEKIPNNSKYLDSWRNDIPIQNIHKKWKEYLIQFNNLMQMMKDKFDQKNIIYCYDDIDLNKLSDYDTCKFSFMLLNKMKELMHIAILENLNRKNEFVNDIIQKFCDKDTKKIEIYKNIIESILNHEKYKSWNNSYAFKFSFLIKYCSSSAYYRLYEMLGEKLPPPMTVQSHFKKQIVDRENILVNAYSVNQLLNQYHIDVKDKINDLLIEYNKAFKTNLTYDTFKIHVCLSSDAASLTPFTNQQKDSKLKDSTKENHYNDEKAKIFENLVNGGLDKDEDFRRSMEIRETIPDQKVHHFFTMILQPFIWNFPLTVVHLSKSVN